MKKSFHYLTTNKHKTLNNLGTLQAECKDTSRATLIVITVILVIAAVAYYLSSIFTNRWEIQSALFVAVLCTIAGGALLYHYLYQGVFFYEYGFTLPSHTYFYDDIEFVEVKREYFKKDRKVARIVWEFKLKDKAKPIIIDSREYPSLIIVIEELCKQCDLKRKISEDEISES